MRKNKVVRNFLLERLSILNDILKDYKFSIKYAYEDSTDFHIIEIFPESIRRGNEKYMEWEFYMWKEFPELYPKSNLIISAPDITNNMNNLQCTYISDKSKEEEK